MSVSAWVWPTRFEACDARGDVDAVAIEIVTLDDHVTEIDADAQFDAAVRPDIRVPRVVR